MVTVVINFFDDLHFLTDAIASVPSDLPVYAIDGRFASFPGDYDLTPDAREFCEPLANVTYVAPPPDQRPFGADRPSANPLLRYGIYRMAEFMFYDVLPQDEWVLKLDADECLRAFDRAVLDDLDPELKYEVPMVRSSDGVTITPTRLCQPRYWTFWLPDLSFPRDEYPRETPVEELFGARRNTEDFKKRTREVDGIDIENREAERRASYVERRQQQLRMFGRGDRANELRDFLAWREKGE